MAMIQYIARRLNVKAASMLIALLLSIGGILMIFIGIRDMGSIDIKSPFMTGQVQSGFVGISLLFISLCITVACLYSKKSSRQITIKVGDIEVQCDGQVKSEEDLDAIRKLCKDILDRKI